VGTYAAEVQSGERFEFGKNWSRFLHLLNVDRIASAMESLQHYLEVPDLRGRTFLDIGSGSGLFSLAARRLGARVHSFDFDPNSVNCTRELRQRYFPDSPDWIVEEGSALDSDYLGSLGTFDIVYSWGVLHHTGQMWLGLENAQMAVAPGGKLFIAIYNDTGTQSARWLAIKKTYNRLPAFMRPWFALLVIAPREGKEFMLAMATGRPGEFVRRWTQEPGRGMSHWYDIIDWVGGLPYEVAMPEQIFDFHKERGFTLTKLMCGRVGLGCNQFVFQKIPTPVPLENGRVTKKTAPFQRQDRPNFD
jgi:2-polyprenyl-3-methyl-5-hydroxy-6-metoxy-1,4-benzoquinol methylase